MKKVQKKAPNKAQKKILPKTQPPKTVSDENANRLRFFVERKDAMAETIRQLVEIESPSDNKQAVDRLGALLAGRFEGLGGHSKFHRTQGFGDHLQVDFAGGRSGKPVLLLGHIDTVYPMGTLAGMPCHVDGWADARAGSTGYEVGHRVDALRHRRPAYVAQRQLAASGYRTAGFGRGSGQRFLSSHYREPRQEIGGGACP